MTLIRIVSVLDKEIFFKIRCFALHFFISLLTCRALLKIRVNSKREMFMKKDQKRKIVVVDAGVCLEKSSFIVCCYSPYIPLR